MLFYKCFCWWWFHWSQGFWDPPGISWFQCQSPTHPHFVDNSHFHWLSKHFRNISELLCHSARMYSPFARLLVPGSVVPEKILICNQFYQHYINQRHTTNKRFMIPLHSSTEYNNFKLQVHKGRCQFERKNEMEPSLWL